MRRERVSGRDFLDWMRRAVEKFRDECVTVDRINIFPVPDGDTGHNMLGTLEEGLRHMERTSKVTMAAMTRALADGALAGARGNSGMILSQLFRGMAEAAHNRSEWTAAELAEALRRGANTAYAQVYRPVEGTVLTVARVAADAAAGMTVGEVLTAALAAAEAALAATPRQLSALERAGVVDAGGLGWVIVLRAWQEAAGGRRAERALTPIAGPTGLAAAGGPAGAIRFPYDIEALIAEWDRDVSVEEAVEVLSRVGDSIVVAPAGDGVKIHVHTDRPETVFGHFVTWGQVAQMELLDMRRQAADKADLSLTVVAEPTMADVFRGTRVLFAADPALDRPGVLWVAPDRPLREAFGAETVGIAGQLVLEYDPERTWDENRRVFQQMVDRLEQFVVDRCPGGYEWDGRRYPTRDELGRALEKRLAADGVVTVYLAAGADEEEASWWQTRLNAAIVRVAEARRWMEVIVQR